MLDFIQFYFLYPAFTNSVYINSIIWLLISSLFSLSIPALLLSYSVAFHSQHLLFSWLSDVVSKGHGFLSHNGRSIRSNLGWHPSIDIFIGIPFHPSDGWLSFQQIKLVGNFLCSTSPHLLFSCFTVWFSRTLKEVVHMKKRLES